MLGVALERNQNRQPPLRDQSPEAHKLRAEAGFKRLEAQTVELPKAMQEYRASEQAQREQLLKLRADRLARERPAADSAKPEASAPL